jgi:hypothetical protein
MNELDLLVENYFTDSFEASDLFRLVEQVMVEASDTLFQQIGSALNSQKEQLHIASIMKSGASTLYVRFKTKRDRANGIAGVKQLLVDSGFAVEDRKLSAHSVPVSYISGGDPSLGTIKLVYKYDIQTRVGLAFEHILAYVMTGEITDKLKKAIDLPQNTDKQDVFRMLDSDKWAQYVERAQAARVSIEERLGEIKNTTVAGGTGSKADLVLTLADGNKVGISLKLAIGSTNIYIYNKDLGDGSEAKSLIPSPTGEPWWMIGRKRFFSELRQQQGFPQDIVYDPNSSDYNPPDWMLEAKKQYSAIYKAVVVNLFAQIRNLLFESLGNMTLENLADVVEDAHLGKAAPNEARMPLYKLESAPSGISLEEVPQTTPNMVEIEMNKLMPKNMVYFRKSSAGAPTSTIIIDIPGMHKVYINSVKFRSNLLATNRGNLKIKTR